MRERTTLNAAIILMAGALLIIVVPAATPVAEAQDTPKEVYEPAQALPAEAYAAKAGAAYAIGMLAYIWGYPLMDMYRLARLLHRRTQAWGTEFADQSVYPCACVNGRQRHGRAIPQH